MEREGKAGMEREDGEREKEKIQRGRKERVRERCEERCREEILRKKE